MIIMMMMLMLMMMATMMTMMMIMMRRYGASHSIGIGMPQVVARNWADFVELGKR